jgi:hypothetical protein
MRVLTGTTPTMTTTTGAGPTTTVIGAMKTMATTTTGIVEIPFCSTGLSKKVSTGARQKSRAPVA